MWWHLIAPLSCDEGFVQTVCLWASLLWRLRERTDVEKVEVTLQTTFMCLSEGAKRSEATLPCPGTTHICTWVHASHVLLLIFLWEQVFVTLVAVTEKIIRGFCRKLQEQASCLDAVHNWTGYAFESFMILWSVNLRASHLGLNSVWCSSQIISSAIQKCALIVRWKMFCSAQMSDTKFKIVGGL